MVQEAPIHHSHVYGRIKISQTIFQKGHPWNIPVKLFQNLTTSFGEERIGWMENIVGKGKKDLPAFSPFPTMFSKGFFFRVVKSRDV